MVWQTHYERWKNEPSLSEDLKKELIKIQSNEQLLEDCFYKNLEFGTGGMRGEIGPGINRMNRYTIRKASEGLANYIKEFGNSAMQRGVAIAYDSRHYSYEFALEAALTLGNNGIQTYLFDTLRPTPVLSFSVRHLQAFAGIVITASHNPPEYNGYKVYGEDGAQLTPEPANKVIEHVNRIENELLIEIANKEELLSSGLLKIIRKEVDEAYLEHLKTIVINQEVIHDMSDKLNIVFTPLHGTANHPVRDGLAAIGFKNVTVVKEQELPDPNFSTVQSPNPEEHEAFEFAIKYGNEVNADLLIATDPDADRVGIAVKNDEGEYVVLTGNQTGALMLEYLLSQKDIPSNGIVLKTIVTSELGRAIANAYGAETIDTLTGFKFIAEKIEQFHQHNTKNFLFGYEESYGYLISDFVRDKDAVQASIFAAEMAAFYKSQGKTLYEALNDVFEKYGFYREDLHSFTLKGKQGAEQIEMILSSFRENPPSEIAGKEIKIIEDYKRSERTYTKDNQKETIALPVSNVLKYILNDESWICLRPSGTEPKIKFYFGVKGKSHQESKERLSSLKASIIEQVEHLIH